MKYSILQGLKLERLTVSPEPVEIFGIILETIEIVRNLADENQIKIESDDFKY